VRFQLPIVKRRTPPFIPCQGSCGRPSRRLRLNTPLRLPLSHRPFEIRPSTTSRHQTHLRQHLPPPGFAKLFPSRGKAGFYFGFITTFPVCVRSASTLPGRKQSVSRHQISAICYSASTSIGSPSSRATRLLSTVLRQSTVALFTTTGLSEENSERPDLTITSPSAPPTR